MRRRVSGKRAADTGVQEEGGRLSGWRLRMGGGLGDNSRCAGGGGASYLSKVLGDRQTLLQVI